MSDPSAPVSPPTPAEQLAAIASERRAKGEAFVQAVTGKRDDAPPLAFTWEDIDGVHVRVPVDADAREGAIAEYRRQAEVERTTTAAIEAELATFAAMDPVRRAERYTPDVRAALERRMATRSPI